MIQETRKRVSSTDPLGHARRTVFDAAGRPERSEDAAGGPTFYTYDDADQLTRVTGPTTGEADLYTYTANGQLASIKREGTSSATVLQWNVSGQLTSVETPDGQREAYRYHRPLGPLDNLRWETTRAGGTVQRHLWHPGGNLLADQDGRNDLVRRHVTGPSLDSVHATHEVSASATSAVLRDHLGSVRRLVSSTGSTSTTHRYRAFGARAPPEPPLIPSRLGFTGRETSPLTGLVYLRNRWYSPQLGRFLSQDPLGLAGGLNLYAYARLSPLLFVDPLGLQALELANEIGRQFSADLDDPLRPGHAALNGLLLFTVAPVLRLGEGAGTFAGNLENLGPLTRQLGVLESSRVLNDSAFAAGLDALLVLQAASGVTSLSGRARRRLCSMRPQGARGGGSSGSRVFERVVSRAELEATLSSGFIRGGRAGRNFFTNEASINAKRAQQRLGLDGPLREFRIRFRVGDEIKVEGPGRAPGGRSGTPGGGREFFTDELTPIEILQVDLLRR